MGRYGGRGSRKNKNKNKKNDIKRKSNKKNQMPLPYDDDHDDHDDDGNNNMNKKRNNNQNKNSNNKGNYDEYTQDIVDGGNYKMEVYYALQGLHDYHWRKKKKNTTSNNNNNMNSNNDDDIDDNNNDDDNHNTDRHDDDDDNCWELHRCRDLLEKNTERKCWRSCIGTVLPSSFRMNHDLPISLSHQLQDEFHTIIQELQRNEEDEEQIQQIQIQQQKTEKQKVEQEDEQQQQQQRRRRRKIECKKLQFFMNQRTSLSSSSAAAAAYQLNIDRTTLRKDEHYKERLHPWLRIQTDSGYISRQETVSMIPPVVLQIQSNDIVLDMCAAPGSKTSQLLSCLGPHGILIANDASIQRAHMLVHQLKPITHNNPIALFTTCDAQFFPTIIKVEKEDNNNQKNNNKANNYNNSKTQQQQQQEEQNQQQQQNTNTNTSRGHSSSSSSYLQFNKILCDVPCSGDGTTRKNIGIWKTWNQLQVMSLHVIQLSIAYKGVSQLLQVSSNNNKKSISSKTNTTTTSSHYNNNNNNDDGLLCYSTCSLNPIENEAVVAELLRRSRSIAVVKKKKKKKGGDGDDDIGDDDDDNGNEPSSAALELVDIRHLLPGFRTRPGMTSWKVLCEPRKQQNTNKNKQMKNEQKKNNKMKQKRMEHNHNNSNNNECTTNNNNNEEEEEEEEKKVVDTKEVEKVEGSETADDTLPSKKTTPTTKDVNDINNENDQDNNNNNNNNNEDKKYNNNNNNHMKKKFDPTDIEMTDENLMKMAESCGLHYYHTYDDVPNHLQRRIRRSCFPPTSTENEWMNLQRCIRCMSHDNNTGGFFIALLRKIKPLSRMDHRIMMMKQEKQEKQQKEDEEDDNEPDMKRPRVDNSNADEGEIAGGNDEDDDDETMEQQQQEGVDVVDDFDDLDDENKPIQQQQQGQQQQRQQQGQHQSRAARFVKGNLVRGDDGKLNHELGKDDFIPLNDEVLDPLIEFYGLQGTNNVDCDDHDVNSSSSSSSSSSFFPRDLFMTRASGDAKILYYISRPIKDLFDMGIQKRITIVGSGLRAFVRNSNQSTTNNKGKNSNYSNHHSKDKTNDGNKGQKDDNDKNNDNNNNNNINKDIDTVKDNNDEEEKEEEKKKKSTAGSSSQKNSDNKSTNTANNNNSNNLHNCDVKYRLCQDGAHYVEPYMNHKRKIMIYDENVNDFNTCLMDEFHTIDLFSEHIKQQILQLSVGSFLIVYQQTQQEKQQEKQQERYNKLVATMWRGRGKHVDRLIAKSDLEAIRSRLRAITLTTTTTTTTAATALPTTNTTNNE